MRPCRRTLAGSCPFRRNPPMLPTETRMLPTSSQPASPAARRGGVPFGADTYDVHAMRDTLPRHVFDKLVATIRRHERLDGKIAAEVAHGMKEWALARGATHFT